jgi:glycosyltransferase involved in cell wall biosynthesis
MNIAIFASAFHPHFGGVEELCRQLALEYRRRGINAIVVTNRWPRDLPRHEIFEGIPVYRIAMRTPTGTFRAKLNYHWSHRSIQSELKEILISQNINLLHIQCVSSNGLYALRAKHQLKLPLVTTLQGELTMDATGLYQRSAYAKNLFNRVMKESEIVTGCSRKTLEDGEEFFGQKLGARGRIVFNGASIEDFDGAHGYVHSRPYILAIGRMVSQKGFDILLQAYSNANVELDLIIAGDGPELENLRLRAKDLRIEERIKFVGRADRKLAVSLFVGSEFFVLPSRADEGLPVVCAEAFAAGKAVVATRSGGVPEAISDGIDGLIVEKGNVEQLATALTRMAEDASFRVACGAKLKLQAKRFSWQTIADEYLGIYRDALSRCG